MAAAEGPEQRVMLHDEAGTEHQFLVRSVVQIHGSRYALLSDAADPEDPHVVIMRVEGETLVSIEDQSEFDHVVAHLEGHGHH